MSQACPDCGESYARLGSHWTGDCSAPELTEHQLDIIKGLLMGDAWLRTDGNSMLSIKMTNREYLEYLQHEFGVLGTGVNLRRENENPNWSDSYYFSIRSHKGLNRFDNWYEGGEKTWPQDLQITPTVMKHWYAGDGHLELRGESERVKIGLSNESGNEQKISKMLNRSGLEYTRWDEYELEDGRVTASIVFGVNETKQLFEYMGEPLTGFENKWSEV